MDESNDPPDHTPLQNLTVLQHICQGSNLVFLTLFSLIRNRNVSFVCLQDPPLFQGDPLRAPGYQCFSSNVIGVTILLLDVCATGNDSSLSVFSMENISLDLTDP